MGRLKARGHAVTHGDLFLDPPYPLMSKVLVDGEIPATLIQYAVRVDHYRVHVDWWDCGVLRDGWFEPSRITTAD